MTRNDSSLKISPPKSRLSWEPRLCDLPESSRNVVAYLGYILKCVTISSKSLQSYLSEIYTVHNDFEYPPPVCGHLVKLDRKVLDDLEGAGLIHQPQQDLLFPSEHIHTTVNFGLETEASKNQDMISTLIC
jgi:hypothetical protein